MLIGLFALRLDWAPVSGEAEDLGLMIKELRRDPGSGARTWLLSVSPSALRRLSSSSVMREGYLVSGTDTLAECLNGEPVAGDYRDGGYFLRPPGAVSGGPGSISPTGATWLLREASKSRISYPVVCPTAESL